MTNHNQICFYPEADDTNSFGFSVAINNQYLAVGDPGANRIVIYQKDSHNRWQRDHKIYPPENSLPHKAGFGFGGNFELNGNILMVHSATRKNPTAPYLVNPKDYKAFLQGNIDDYKVLSQKYIFDLDRKNMVMQIDCSSEKQKNFTNFYILHNGEPRLITLPNNNEEMFGVSIAIHNNMMLIGSPPSRKNSDPKQGKGWLFNLNNLDSEPKVLTAEKACLGKSVALSSQFAVVGNRGNEQLLGNLGLYPKTLIVSLDNDSFSLIDNQGYLSIYKDILAVMRPLAAMQTPLLQLFYLDKNAIPHLVAERKSLDDIQVIEGKYLLNTLVQNGWLITVERLGRKASSKICLESIEQIIN